MASGFKCAVFHSQTGKYKSQVTIATMPAEKRAELPESVRNLTQLSGGLYATAKEAAEASDK